MKQETLNKLSPKGREKVIKMEGELREIDEELEEIEFRIKHFEELER